MIYTYTAVLYHQQYVNVHMLHAIGLAFDNINQVDYQKYMIGITDAKKRHMAVRSFYSNLFHKIFTVCRYLKKSSLVMSLVGANNFAERYRDDKVTSAVFGLSQADMFQYYLWWPVWDEVSPQYQDIHVSFTGIGKKDNIETVSHFPRLIDDIDTENTLIVNAWDCWSIVGNGNGLDNSLDGHVGRHSTVALTSWPLTNIYLKSNSRYIKL